MSALRNVGKKTFGSLFTLALILTVTIFSMIEFTQLGSIRNVVSEILESQGRELEISGEGQNALSQFKSQCEREETGSLIFDLGDVEIKCEDVAVLESSADVTGFVSSKIVEKVYFQEYDCDILECVERGEQPFPLLITQHANNFYKEIFNYAIIVTIIFGALFVFLTEGLNKRLKGLGFSLLWSSAPFIVFSFFAPQFAGLLIPPQLLSTVQPVIDNVIGSMLQSTLMIYVYILAAGIALVVAGYLIKRSESVSGK